MGAVVEIAYLEYFDQDDAFDAFDAFAAFDGSEENGVFFGVDIDEAEVAAVLAAMPDPRPLAPLTTDELLAEWASIAF